MLSHSASRFELIDRAMAQARKVHWNLTPPLLYEEVVGRREAMMAEDGALVVFTGKCTGRSPNDKFFVEEASSREHVAWGRTNRPFPEAAFERLKDRILEYCRQTELFVQDCYGGADPEQRFPTRIITDTAWESLFAYNMFIHAPAVPGEAFDPEFTVLVASGFEAEPEVDGTRSDVVIAIHLGQKLALIAGTRYAGEIKKTVFTVLNYLYPLAGVLPMHCAANLGVKGDTALFFGLSGTGKTTLSTDPARRLIGDDEHGWSGKGIFNFEGGCYAKVIRLSPRDEPQIHGMTRRFGTILENVVIDPDSRQVDLGDDSITENTRASYRLDALPNHEPSGMGAHPHNVIFLTADAFGVLPPLARLTPEQAMYHFLSGYTAKVAGTEKGVKTPQATFSTCFGGPFMVHPPMVYARLLGEKLRAHGSTCWLVNTGWSGGGVGQGGRIPIAHTRAMVAAVLGGALEGVPFVPDPVFGLSVPTACPGVPPQMLSPRGTWSDPAAYDAAAQQLAGLFIENFEQYAASVPPEVQGSGPRRS